MTDTTKRLLTIGEATNPVTTKPDAGLEAWQDEKTRKANKEADAGNLLRRRRKRPSV